MLKLLQTIIDNVLLSVGYQHTFKLNSDEVLLHDLTKDITAPKEVPSAFQVLIEEGCSTLCFAEHSAGGGFGLSAVFVHPDASSGGTLSCRFPPGNSEEQEMPRRFRPGGTPGHAPPEYIRACSSCDRRCCEDFGLHSLAGSELGTDRFEQAQSESVTPTTDKDLPSMQFDQFLFVKEDCRLADRQQESALVPPAYIKALQTLIAL